MNADDFWKDHLAAIEAAGISTKAYAEREGLRVQDLYAARRKLKIGGYRAGVQGAGESNRFVRVVSDSPVARNPLRIEAGIVSLQFASLPDPDWLGALLRVLQEA